MEKLVEFFGFDQLIIGKLRHSIVSEAQLRLLSVGHLEAE